MSARIMSTVEARALQQIKDEVEALVARAERRGIVITVRQQHDPIPAMGEYETVVEVRLDKSCYREVS